MDKISMPLNLWVEVLDFHKALLTYKILIMRKRGERTKSYEYGKIKQELLKSVSTIFFSNGVVESTASKYPIWLGIPDHLRM